MNAQVLNHASKSAHLKNIERLRRNARSQNQYSNYPVHESEFWASLMQTAKDPKQASKVLKEIEIIENEPCFENDRIVRMVETVKNMAKETLRQYH